MQEKGINTGPKKPPIHLVIDNSFFILEALFKRLNKHGTTPLIINSDIELPEILDNQGGDVVQLIFRQPSNNSTCKWLKIKKKLRAAHIILISIAQNTR